MFGSVWISFGIDWTLFGFDWNAFGIVWMRLDCLARSLWLAYMAVAEAQRVRVFCFNRKKRVVHLHPFDANIFRCTTYVHTTECIWRSTDAY